MSRAALSGAQLNGLDLRGVDLSAADLSGANLSNANLAGARLLDTDLRMSNLTGCNLDGAEYNAETVWPTGIDPTSCGAIFKRPIQTIRDTFGKPIHGVVGNDLRGAVLTGVDLGYRTPGIFQQIKERVGAADFREASLTGADFSNAILRWADFTGADLSGANFTGADLYFARFTKAKLTGTNGAIVRGVDFSGADTTQAVRLTIGGGSWLVRASVKAIHRLTSQW